ncbi:MAG TPA: LysM peptidoglycan-binding domain-containing protein, partial [Chloroflexota bacterium]|nr:LysM peptidoglycan-binding domain-containing protein [Chloroflexota bacterium]
MQTREFAAVQSAEAQGSRLSLATLTIILADTGGLLLGVGGPPHLPARIPSWLEIEVTLRGSDVPLGALGYLFTMAAWVVWLWIVGTLALQIILLIIERLANGAPRVRTIRRAVNSVTLPVVRRAAEAVFGGLLLVSIATQAAPSAAAAPAPAPIAAVTKQAMYSAETPKSPSTSEIQYIVQPGDNLWAISRRFYGTGLEYPRLVEANVGRQMADGRVFSRDGVIHSGWVLRVPLPSTAVEEVDGQAFYTVETGDTLSGIAARLLGDEAKWPEIFQLNAGKASVKGRGVLTDPDVIWPGLRLELPAGAVVTPPEPQPAPAT